MAERAAQPFAAAGGLQAPPAAPSDPLAALDDLMVVVEALCPRWPSRAPFPDGGVFRL